MEAVRGWVWIFSGIAQLSGCLLAANRGGGGVSTCNYDTMLRAVPIEE